jgi:hypothetical protein
MMNHSNDLCTCADHDLAKADVKGGLCPVCRKRMKKVEELSDSLIEATFEILDEEGAIWSGAR